MAAPTKAQTDYCCALAAIQSLNIDKGGQQFTQSDLIDRYPDWTSKGKIHSTEPHTIEGGLALQEFLHVLKDLGLAASFRIGIGRPYLEAQAGSLADGVFLYTMNYQDGKYGCFHCWRVHGWDGNNFSVVNSDRRTEEQYLPIPWHFLDLFGCTVIICEPPAGR